MKLVLLIATLALLWPAAAFAEDLSIVVRPAQVFQGGVAEIVIYGPMIADVKARRGADDIPIFQTAPDAYAALVGIDIAEKPGKVEIAVSGRSPQEAWSRTAAINVRHKDFPREEISVPPAFDQLDAATLERIKKEQSLLKALWKVRSPTRLWQEPFAAPVPIKVNSAFGFRRVVNGLARAPHEGVDLKAALGAPVVAANDGRVVLEDNLFFSGNSLFLDHGGGLYTMYFHLSEFRVPIGASVRKGDVIGLAGMTGRVTGPHLHWGARLNGARIDPLDLLALDGEGRNPQ
ncbi:MAG TPA: M23 family metallopeptidase [Candidatus Binatia bacterium]|jgi:murein DD-endopeptidase MepM/ murein hydrolase activator NlpD